MTAISTSERNAVSARLLGLVAEDAERRARVPLAWSLALSLVLHAALWAGVWLAWRAAPAPRPPQRLLIELMGVVSDHQAEEARAGQPAPAPKPSTPPPPRTPPEAAPPRRTPPAKAVQHTDVDSPVKLQDKTVRDDAPPQPQPSPPAPTPLQAAEAPKADGAAAQQVRQTIAHTDTDLDARRRYLAELTRTIKARLAYPPDAGGVTGTPVVAFRLAADGRIEPGSLAIRRSSGYAVLDAQALRAVRAAAPFEPPPQAMAIALEMPFSREP